jgi:hypothetical protein
VGVHATVGQLERGLRALRLGRDLDDAEGGGDDEALAALAERERRGRHDRGARGGLVVEQDAELVAAEPVGAAGAATEVARSRPRRASSASPALWPKASL